MRKEKYELPPEAIREMIINAHCHRNILDESCIQVAIYDDRLEVTSPGGLYNGLTYEEVMNGHSFDNMFRVELFRKNSLTKRERIDFIDELELGRRRDGESSEKGRRRIAILN